MNRLGTKHYEFSDHLGNVLVTILDKRTGTGNVGGNYTGWLANVSAVNDYYPFGFQMSERSAGIGGRYSFNGMEQDNEVKGTGNSLDFGARMYDSRIARFLSVDPLAHKFPNQSSFLYAGNNPILYIDKNGEFKLNYTEEQLKDLGLTKVEVARFENIVANIYNLVENNSQALDIIAKTTGFSQETIKADFQINDGPTISIANIGGGAKGGMYGIIIDRTLIKHLASIDGSDKANLSEQVLAMALTIIHEYGHYGDQLTNDGNNTGQYDMVETQTPTGTVIKPRNHSEIYGMNNKDRGKQAWTRTLTGHRGTDIEIMGFGIHFSVDRNGKHTRDKIIMEWILPKYQDKIPTSLPAEAEGENILNTLNVRQ